MGGLEYIYSRERRRKKAGEVEKVNDEDKNKRGKSKNQEKGE